MSFDFLFLNWQQESLDPGLSYVLGVSPRPSVSRQKVGKVVKMARLVPINLVRALFLYGNN